MKIKIKKRYIVLILTIVINLIIIVSFIAVKRNNISERIKNVLISRLQPLLKTDDLSIEDLGMNFRYITIDNVTVKKDNYSTKVGTIKVEYSILKLFSKGMNFKEWINNIEIDGLDIIIDNKIEVDNKPLIELSSSKENKGPNIISSSFKIEQYKKILSSLNQFAYLEAVKIKNVNFFLLNYSDVPILSSLSGEAVFNSFNNQIKLDMKGNLLNLEEDNVHFSGYIDYKYLLSSFQVQILKSKIPRIDKTINGKKISLDQGEYSSKFTLEINKLGDDKIDFFGYVNLFEMALSYDEDKVNLKELSSTISFFNGDIFFNKFSGKIQDSEFSIEGKVKNIFNPRLDFYLIIDKVSGIEIKKNLKLFSQQPNLDEHLLFGDDNSLFIHAGGDIEKGFNLDYDLFSKQFYYKNRLFSETSVNGSILEDRIKITKINSLSGSNVFNLDGEYIFNGTKKNSYDFNFKLSGAIFSELSIFSKTTLDKMSTILEGKVKKNKTEGFSVKAKLDVYDFSKNIDKDQNFRSADLYINDDGLLKFKIIDQFGVQLLKGDVDLVKSSYSIIAEDFRSLINEINTNFVKEENSNFKIIDILFAEKDSLSLSVDGNMKDIELKIFKKSHDQYNDDIISIKANLLKDSILNSIFKYKPNNSNNTIILPSFQCNILYNLMSKDISVSNILLNDEVDVGGELKLNTKTSTLSGNLFHSRLDFSKLFNNNDIRTLFKSNTFLNIKFDGTIAKPYIDLYAKENDLKLNLLGDEETITELDDNYINADIEIHLEDDNLRVEKIILFNDTTKLFSLTGKIENFKKYNFSSFGIFNLKTLLASQNIEEISGRVEYEVEFKGADILSDFNISSGDIKVWDLNIYDEKFKFAYCLFDGSIENGVNIKELRVIHDKYVNIVVNGNIPISMYEPLELDAFFYGNILEFLADKVEILKDGTSVNEGNISIRGSLKKPKLENFELYFLDGTLRVKNITKLLSNITGKFIMDENRFVKIIGFNSISSVDNRRVILNNYQGYKDFEDVVFPLGINLGAVTVSMPDGGITGRVPGFMKMDDFGILKLKGFNDDDKFVVGKRDGEFTISGAAEIQNIALTWPLLMDEFKKKDKSNKEKSTNIFDYVDFDLLVVPISGNTYFYDRGESNKSFFEKILSSFSLGNATSLNNVLLHVDGQKEGVKIEGLYLRPNEFKLSGSASCSSGRLGFSAFSFDVENASILFDDYRNKEGYIDPYLSGLGKTLLKSKNFENNTNGFSSVEDFFLTLVTRDENDLIIDRRGGRASNYSIDIVDSYGNSLFDNNREEFDEIIFNKEDDYSGGYYDFDTENTVLTLFHEAIDRRVFDPLLSPLESAIGDVFGGYVKINPKVTGNIQRDWEITNEDGKYGFGDYIIGSEVYISKYFNNYFGVTLNSKYIGEDDYADILDREFGYQNKLSLDFRITNSIFTNIGYEQNTLDDEIGPFVGLSIRYKFINVRSQHRQNLDKYFGYHYDRNFLYREEE